MAPLTLTLLLFILYMKCTTETQFRKEKRLLIGDPASFESRMSHLESLVQQLVLENAQLKADVTMLKTQGQEQNSTIKRLEMQKSTTGGATYVRWGTHFCPNTTAELIYSGFAGGGWYNYEGAGVKYLCMPRDPIYGSRSKPTAFNHLYGVEYETNFWGTNSADEDVPCAVCKSKSGSSMLMIPGRNACYRGWTQHYNGYIASSYYNHKAQNEYVCVEEKAEYLFGGQKGTDGALFYPVLSMCGALKCPPYRNDVPVTCVVCTQ